MSALRHIVALVAVGAVLAAGDARAAPGASADEARARDAYERGTIALRNGDYARAAAEFAQADSIAPNPVTLRAALNAATLADDPVLGTELLARADRGPSDKALTEAVLAARPRFAHRTGRIVVRCGPAGPCLATVDGAALEPAKPRIVAVGVHTVTLLGGGAPEVRMTWVAADQTVEVAIAPPAGQSSKPPPPPSPAPAPPPEHEASGVAPGWFFVATAVTAAAAGLTIWSGVDTLNRHAAFDNAGCRQGPRPDCGALAGDGRSAERRTNVFLIGTAALALGTAGLGVFLVRWGGPRRESVGLVMRGPSVSLHATF
jgi:hypothetical protein